MLGSAYVEAIRLMADRLPWKQQMEMTLYVPKDMYMAMTAYLQTICRFPRDAPEDVGFDQMKILALTVKIATKATSEGSASPEVSASCASMPIADSEAVSPGETSKP